MLNKDGVRELAYIVKITNIRPIEGKDRVECAVVNGWTVMVRKGQFNPDDLAIYFEVDSKVPEEEPFMFLKPKHFKIKTQKYGNFYSQGLLMSAEDFGGEFIKDAKVPYLHFNGKDYYYGDFVTKDLGVIYSVKEDNNRKSDPDKYKLMAKRRPDIFKKAWAQKMMKTNFGRKIMFLFFGNKKDEVKRFPKHFPYISKTDEERIENMVWILEDPHPWIKTTKIDGTSATYILERKRFGKNEFYVYSRNIRQFDEDQECYHDSNVYWEAENKFHIREFLESFLKDLDCDYVCIQGEIAGPNIQGNPHKFEGLRFFGFNLIDSVNGRWNSVKAAAVANQSGIEWVPIIDAEYHLPKTMEEMKEDADGPCEAPGAQGLREGYVYRSFDGKQSFKNVSRKFLIKKGE